jgi:hypothetical protein
MPAAPRIRPSDLRTSDWHRSDARRGSARCWSCTAGASSPPPLRPGDLAVADPLSIAVIALGNRVCHYARGGAWRPVPEPAAERSGHWLRGPGRSLATAYRPIIWPTTNAQQAEDRSGPVRPFVTCASLRRKIIRDLIQTFFKQRVLLPRAAGVPGPVPGLTADATTPSSPAEALSPSAGHPPLLLALSPPASGGPVRPLAAPGDRSRWSPAEKHRRTRLCRGCPPRSAPPAFTGRLSGSAPHRPLLGHSGAEHHLLCTPPAGAPGPTASV